MNSIQGYNSGNSLTTSYPPSTRATTSSSFATTSDSGSYNLHDMTIGQIRDMTDQMATDGKLDPMQWATLQVSGWMDQNPSDPASGQAGLASSGRGVNGIASRSDTQTYDVVSTLEGAAQFEQAHGNTQGATEYQKLLNTFESSNSQEKTVSATA
ncbi:MAG: hypothetical protein P4K83_05645 [Terracidiphilus sp.]|nr:hypothetical protein [Terracidiphilus sp.]